jgi:hypothetical protein
VHHQIAVVDQDPSALSLTKDWAVALSLEDILDGVCDRPGLPIVRRGCDQERVRVRAAAFDVDDAEAGSLLVLSCACGLESLVDCFDDQILLGPLHFKERATIPF